MGAAPSKKIEEILESSSAFKGAVDTSFSECLVLAQHSSPGLRAYQLLDASVRVYEKLAIIEEDIVARYKEKWLPQSPMQGDVDQAICKGAFFAGGQRFMSLEEFRLFSTILFRDMGLANACHKLAVYVPMGSISVLCAHLFVKRLPLVGPVYRAACPLMPGLLLGSIVGVVISQLSF